MAPMQITGLDGCTLKDTWKDGAEAYLGLTVNGFLTSLCCMDQIPTSGITQSSI